jgi:hypothetical protein
VSSHFEIWQKKRFSESGTEIATQSGASLDTGQTASSFRKTLRTYYSSSARVVFESLHVGCILL